MLQCNLQVCPCVHIRNTIAEQGLLVCTNIATGQVPAADSFPPVRATALTLHICRRCVLSRDAVQA